MELVKYGCGNSHNLSEKHSGAVPGSNIMFLECCDTFPAIPGKVCGNREVRSRSDFRKPGTVFFHRRSPWESKANPFPVDGSSVPAFPVGCAGTGNITLPTLSSHSRLFVPGDYRERRKPLGE